MKNSSKPTNVHDLISVGQHRLQTATISSARLDALILLGHVLNKDRAWLLSHSEQIVSPSQITAFEKLIEQRTRNIPVAYLVEQKEFYGRSFYVTPEVLVPRPETEQIIEQILTIDSGDKPMHILDLGTGSGVIAITLALERPNWKVTATDISLSALRVAKSNAKRFATQNVMFSNQDLLDGDKRNYDIIVTNPPYVPTSLHSKSDIAHEPPLALFAGEDGLDIYRKLFAQLASRQNPVPQVVTESLQNQHAALADIAFEHNYKLIATRQLIQHFCYIY